jgi:hypothetical protein
MAELLVDPIYWQIRDRVRELEAALKAAGLPENTLDALAREFARSDLAIPEFARVPELVRNLTQRVASVRNAHGDAHGKAAGPSVVPQELGNVAVRMAGALIVYLDARAS